MSATVQAPGSVLVGVDGSAHNASAVAWATAEASSSGATLVLVHDDGGSGGAAGRATLERAAADVARVDRDLPVVTRLARSAAPAAGLVGAAREQDVADPTDETAPAMIVVGRRGSGGFREMLLGSTARHLVHDAGPVTVIVPSGWDPDQVEDRAPVVVDARPRPGRAGDEALSTAMARAHRLGRPVLAVSTWSVPPDEALAGRSITQVWSEHADRAEEELAETLAPWRTAYPAVDVLAVATDRHPVATLLDQASAAELIVVPRGSTASAVVEHAGCPVAVV